jgi:hypothetical protein
MDSMELVSNLHNVNSDFLTSKEITLWSFLRSGVVDRKLWCPHLHRVQESKLFLKNSLKEKIKML